ncbi:DNA methyltransferase [Bacillus altitudinis]|nr:MULTISPECIES: DNA methyltransferase [Bacillus]MDH3109162.1 DNA methyltransferase [Bacillus altitudinis]
MGSGTTGIVALKHSRNFIGIESRIYKERKQTLKRRAN